MPPAMLMAPRQRGILMRAALCTLVALLGMAGASYAGDADKDRKPIEKQIKLPNLDFNGYSAQFDTNLSRRPETYAPPGASQFTNDSAEPYVGLKFSKPLK
jgi:hypothetical protein